MCAAMRRASSASHSPAAYRSICSMTCAHVGGFMTRPPLRRSVALVTPFSVAMRLVGYGNAFLIAGTQVLTPVATGLHAAEQHAKQRTLFLEGGKYCLALGLFFVTLFICLGQPLLDLWMGPALRGAWPLLVILGLGELLAMSQWITYSMILGMGRHKLTAC